MYAIKVSAHVCAIKTQKIVPVQWKELYDMVALYFPSMKKIPIFT